MLLIKKIKKLYHGTSSIQLLLSILFLLAITLAFTHTLDTSSKQQIDKAFNRALITFGISKALNGVISVAQGTELAIQPAGIGINLTPGQILDPVNDLIERFSWVMLASTTSLGIQKIFLAMSAWPAFNYFFITCVFLAIIVLYLPVNKTDALRASFLKFVLFLILLRFIVPVASISNEAVYAIFLQPEYTSSTQGLQTATDKISLLNKTEQSNQPDIKKKSVWESAKSFYNSTSDALDMNSRIEKYKKAASDTTTHTINLIVVFIFQAILIPLLFIIILYVIGKLIFRLKTSDLTGRRNLRFTKPFLDDNF